MIRKSCYAGTSPRLGRCGGISPRLTKCNCLAGCRVQPAPTRCRGGLGSPSLRQQPAPTRPGARRKNKLIVIYNEDSINEEGKLYRRCALYM